MVRATYARVFVRLGGSLPPSWTEAKITALCTSADFIIDSFTAPEVMSTTDNNAIEIAVDVVKNMMREADFIHQSSGSSAHDGRQYPLIEILTPDIRERIQAVMSSTNFSTVDMIAE